MSTTTTTIIVYTSGPAAVTTASAAGWHRLDLDLSTWTDEERARLATGIVDTDRGPKLLVRYTNHMEGAPRVDSATEKVGGSYGAEYSPINVAPPTADRLLQLVRDSLAATVEREATEAEESARVEAERVRLLSVPVAELVHVGTYDGGRWSALRGIPAERVDEARAEADARNRRAVAEFAAELDAQRAVMREILMVHAPDVLEVFDAGRAESDALDGAARDWLCAAIGVAPDVLTDYSSVCKRAELDPQHFRALRSTEAACEPFGAEVLAAIGSGEDRADDNAADGACLLVTVRATVAGRRVYLEIPIEHAPQ